MAISKRHRDKAMKIICGFHESKKPGCSIGAPYLTKNGLSKTVDADHVVEVLRSMGYVTYSKNPDGRICEINLTDSGKCYFEKKKDISHEKRIEWIRYIITTVIAALALIIAAIALAAQLGLVQPPTP